MDFRVNKSAMMLAMGVLVLALAGVGCGDDDGAAGTAGTSAGTGGTGGTAGTAGAGGTAGGSAPTVAECTASVETNTGSLIDADSECATCLCTPEANRAPVVACSAGCWALVSCVQTMCAGLSGTDRLMCASNECTTELMAPGATAQGQAVTAPLEGCASQCSPSSNLDAGDVDSGS